MHPCARHEGQQPPALPRLQAHPGAARQLHRRQVAHLHDRHDLTCHVLLRALAQHAPIPDTTLYGAPNYFADRSFAYGINDMYTDMTPLDAAQHNTKPQHLIFFVL